jgi:hypothetical protein
LEHGIGLHSLSPSTRYDYHAPDDDSPSLGGEGRGEDEVLAHGHYSPPGEEKAFAHSFENYLVSLCHPLLLDFVSEGDRFTTRQTMILPLLEERAGVRTSVLFNCIVPA